MKSLSFLEGAIYNDGERLIPGVTHNLVEVVRHRSSYTFFRKVIEGDLAIMEEKPDPVRIVDLGCGVGHGCCLLSEISNSKVLGVDISSESLEYARHHYARANITYRLADLVEFIRVMPEYDYVVSRGVFEHIPNGLHLAGSTKRCYRLLFDVPYDEPEHQNPHHVLCEIREDTLSEFPGVELFFQDGGGVIYPVQHKPPRPNMLMCVSSHPGLPEVSSEIGFPLPAWQPGLGLRLRYLSWSEVLRHPNWSKAVRRLRRVPRKLLGWIRALP